MFAMATIELTNNPPPMIPPIEIIATCRARSDFSSFGAPGVASVVVAFSKLISPRARQAISTRLRGFCNPF